MWEISWQNLLMYSKSAGSYDDEPEKNRVTVDELELLLKSS
jgi:hypothetical protein